MTNETNEDESQAHGQQDQPVFGDAEQFASGVFDSPVLGLAILDNQLRYLAVNDTLAAINGIPAPEHKGKTLREVLGNAALTIEPALDRVLATGKRISNLDVTASLPRRDAAGHFRTNLFPIRDSSGVIAKIVLIIVEITKLQEFEKCLIDLMGHLPGVRDQIVCLGLPNREENDKIQSWLGSIEILENCVRQIHRLSEMLRPPAALTKIVPFQPSQLSLPDFSPITPDKEHSQATSSTLPSGGSAAIHLSPRLVQILQYLAEGKSTKEIANTLGTSARTVDHQRETIMLKLDIHSLTELVHYAVRNKLIKP
jgi:DNA-binding CsgD family transcriptional regulator